MNVCVCMCVCVCVTKRLNGFDTFLSLHRTMAGVGSHLVCTFLKRPKSIFAFTYPGMLTHFHLLLLYAHRG